MNEDATWASPSTRSRRAPEARGSVPFRFHRKPVPNLPQSARMRYALCGRVPGCAARRGAARRRHREGPGEGRAVPELKDVEVGEVPANEGRPLSQVAGEERLIGEPWSIQSGAITGRARRQAAEAQALSRSVLRHRALVPTTYEPLDVRDDQARRRAQEELPGKDPFGRSTISQERPTVRRAPAPPGRGRASVQREDEHRPRRPLAGQVHPHVAQQEDDQRQQA